MSINYKTRPKPKSHSKKQTKGIRSSSGSLELKEPSASYFVRNSEVPEFFGQPLTKGERLPVDDIRVEFRAAFVLFASAR